MTSHEAERPIIQFAWKELDEIGARVKYPSSWNYQVPSKYNQDTHHFIPPDTKKDYGYTVGLAVKGYKNEYGRWSAKNHKEFFINTVKAQVWDRQVDDMQEEDPQHPFISYLGEANEEQFFVGGQILRARWSLNRVVLNTQTNSYYIATFRIPEFRKDKFEDVGREMITSIEFSPDY